jgi:catechol 2,3-dioxygenase-like lactoylglutathione lyase family enzyme
MTPRPGAWLGCGCAALCVALAGTVLAGGGAVFQASYVARPHDTGSPVKGIASLTPVRSVVRIGMTVSDLDRSVQFYAAVLGFEKVSEAEHAGDAFEHLSGVFGARTISARLRLGTEEIELTQYLAPEGRSIPADSRSNDLWFQHIAIAATDINRAYSHLRAHKVRHASSGPQTLPQSLPNAAGISAFYFKDPDGHVLEVIHFPAGKGDPRWQVPGDPDRLFLGIDHTAVVVADTEASLRFYKETLGMRLAGESENFGVEQEHLNNVFGARLKITTLRASDGPGIELLEYLAPAGGRTYPADSRANDLWHWQTTIACEDTAAYEAALRASPATWISPGVVKSPGEPPSLMVRDPDGHAVLITTGTEAAPR